MGLNWLEHSIPTPDKYVFQQALEHQKQLTKPPGSLGWLEPLAAQLASFQGQVHPTLDHIQITVFAGDHGIVEAGVSAFPQAVTVEMVRNFSRGGAAINVLARQIHANMEVVNAGTVNPIEPLEGVINAPVGRGTHNFANQPAMARLQLAQALELGAQAIHRARQKDAQLFIGGEMGIGNTTSATALTAALLDQHVNEITGAGTGLNVEGIQRKAKIIADAVALHRPNCDSALDWLRCVGGFEIAALTGSYIAAAQNGIPSLIDGVISSAAALVAMRIRPECREWMLFSHRSQEPAHEALLRELDAHPLIDLSMRLGEGSGAAVAVPLLKAACALHNEMATFADAQVSEKTDSSQ